MSTHRQLTDVLEGRILVWIRSGAYPHVAAQAEGIPQEVFQRWLARGTRRSPPPGRRYRRFAENVQQAAAMGRLRAELRALEKDPKFWLLSGPGKGRPDCPGWTSAQKALPAREQGDVNLLADPDFGRLIETLLAALIPFPEARKAAVQALQAEPPKA